MRVTPSPTTAGLDVAHYGTSWAAAKTYNLSGLTNGLISSFTTITVLRNSPEETIIRLGCYATVGYGTGRISIDVALRRGDRLARAYVESDSPDNWKVARGVTEAATAIATYGAVSTGGIEAAANDADGNRYVMVSYQAAVTADLTNGALAQNAASTSMDIGVGSVIGGATSAPDGAVFLAKQYLAAQAESQRVVAR